MQKALHLIFFLLFTSIFSYAGNISGVIKDAGTSTPLTGVMVTLKNSTKGAASDVDGKFIIEDVPDGKYELTLSYIGYKKTITQITVKGATTFDFTMEADKSQLKEVTVKTNKITHTESAVVLEMRKSATIVSGISAAQISKTMDRNAADVVKRIPGVTIQEDRFITVRGLSDRYNSVWLNDASAPSSEADKKSFSFDMIPSGLIDRILVFKTPSPDLPGDFAGGMVKIYTTSMPEKNQLTVGLSSSYRSGSTGTDFNFNKPSPTDWMGFDNGMRNIPSAVPSFIDAADPNKNAITKSFPNDWGFNTKATPMDFRGSLTLQNVFKLKKVKIGNTFGVAYSNTNTNYSVSRQEWQDTAIQYNYKDQRSENKVNVGLMDNLAVVWGNNKIEFKNLYSQLGKSYITMRTNQPYPGLSTQDELSYAMGYESRASYNTQLGGTHKSKNDNTKYTWTLGYNDMFKNMPDLRRIRYNKSAGDPDSMYVAQVAGVVDPVNGGGKYYARLSEHTYSFNHMITQKVNIGNAYSFEVNAGNFLEYKQREFSQRLMGYTLNVLQTPPDQRYYLLHQDVGSIFSDQNVGDVGKFQMSEITAPSDKYEGKNTLIASFVSLKLPIGDKINILGGGRYEYNKQEINGYVNLDTIHPSIVTKYFLPSANATYNFNTKSLIRAAYGKTLNRPEFREAAPIYFYDFDQRAGIYGALFPHSFAEKGDTLKVAQVQNFDVRWEWYPSAGEMIHIGGFYKSFKDPIQQIVIPGSGSDSKAYTFANGKSAYMYGVEIDVRKNLGFFDDKFGTNVFKNFVFVGNLSLSKSELSLDSQRIKKIIPKTTMQGQSPYIVNTGFFYQNEKAALQGSLLYNVFGPRMSSLGTTDDPSEGELPFQSLDFSISKTFARYYNISFGVQNLLDQSVRYVQDINRDNKFDKNNDRNLYSYKPGRYFTLGVKIKI
ncbi:TonB-dependent receptor [Taibaiella soli]|uniref:TonB-dependent receptor n=1 Tax=Taibaiella soli TaxID=1649169 RepID=A0A2W2B0I8_9BACT|nr:TonB-dependent receptor [Taibaiella soli]PZF73488.1 hypothetical protein DN068_07120 [Taibaiella soli]